MNFYGILAFVPLSSHVNIAFARDRLSESNVYDLKSFSFTNKGKCNYHNQFADSTKGEPYKAQAIWLGDFATTSAHINMPYGPVYVIFSTVSRSNINNGGVVTLAVARFDENGGRFGDWQDLMSFTVNPGWRIDGESLEAVIDNNQVAITFCLPFSTNVIGRSQAFFLRTDFQGNLINEVAKLKLPKNGNSHYTKVYHPLWNGTCWLVPAETNLHQQSPYFGYVENRVLVFASTDGKAKKFRRRKITQDNPWSFNSLSLASASSGSGQAHSSFLSMQHHAFVPKEEHSVINTTYEYFLYPLNKKGKKAGDPVEVLMPELEHSFQYDPEYPSKLQESYFSNIITSDQLTQSNAINSSDDAGLYVAQAHTLWNYRLHARRCEQQVNLYKIYPQDGSVAHLGNSRKKLEYFRMTVPLIAIKGNMIEVVTNANYSHYPGGLHSYISIMK